MNCRDCIYCNTDYIWCNKRNEEYETVTCDKDRDEFMSEEDCSEYTEYPPYKEHSTKCDTCDKLYECIGENRLIETTIKADNYRHYIFGLDGCPKKMEE